MKGSLEDRAVPRHQSERQIICGVELDREGLDLPPGVLATDAEYENVRKYGRLVFAAGAIEPGPPVLVVALKFEFGQVYPI